MKKLFYICVMLSGMILSSCSDWLDVLPNNEQVTADYWQSKEDVEAMVASGYFYMRNTTPFMIDWGELRGASITNQFTVEKWKLQDFQLIPGSKLCKWDLFYQVINMASSVIAYAPKVQIIDDTYSEAAMRSHQTEAYFMRALMYFYLVRNFKEVPLVLQPYIDDSAPYAIKKSSEEEIIAQIKKDIITALDLNAAKEFYDNDKWAGASKGRSTKWSLYALMADVCLWSEDYDNCVTYTNYLINATASKRPAFMSIPEQWFTIFNPGNSNESIFELNWDAPTFDQTKDNPAGTFTISETANYIYTTTMAERLESESLEAFMIGKDPVRSQYGAYVTLGTIGSQTYCIWKYKGTAVNDITAVRTTSDANYIIYRMADVMLMKAEALIWKGKNSWTEALEIINQIRHRSNLADIPINIDETNELAMLETVLNERDIEFAAEGKRWYDLVRFGKSQNYKYKTQFIEMIVENNSTANDSWIRSVLKNNYAWYLPINQTEIDSNELLEQNPYYATN